MHSLAGPGQQAPATLDYLARHPRLTDWLALSAGALQVSAYAPIEWRASAVIGIALLLLSWQGCSARRAFWRGFLYGLGLFGAGISWIYFSLHLFGDAIAPLAAVLTAGFVAGMALYPALTGYCLQRWFADTTTLARLVVIAPALWALSEWLRHWLLSGFPWLHLGHSQLDWPLGGYLPVAGTFAVSWLTAASAGAVLALCLSRSTRTIGVFVMLVCVWLGGAALRTLEWSTPVGEPLRVRVVQGNVDQHIKFIADILNPSIQNYSRMSFGEQPVDLVVWPETAIPTFFHRVENLILPVAEALHERGTELAIGVLEYRRDERRYYNAVRRVDPGEARPDGLYFKHHLVPFGEFMPFREWLEFLARYILIPMSDIEAGAADQSPMLLAGVRVAVSICYEDAFGEELIRQVPEAGLLLNLSNDAWFGNSLAPHQHLEIARVRTLETARAMIRSTNTGVSAFIDADGRILAAAPQFERVAFEGRLQPREGLTPYVRFGNWPVITALLVVLAAALAWVRAPSALSNK